MYLNKNKTPLHLIPPHVVVANVSVGSAEQVQRSVVKHGRVKRSGGRAGVAPLHAQAAPQGRAAVVDVEVRETAQLAGEAAPEVDIAADRVKAAAVGHSCLGEVTL